MVDEVVTAPVQAATTEPAAPAASIADTKTPTEDSASSVVSNETAVSPVESVKTETTVETPKQETLLGGEKKVEEKPVEAKVEEKPAEVKTEETVIEPPKYEIKVPEGVTVDDAKLGDFTKMLGDFETFTVYTTNCTCLRFHL